MRKKIKNSLILGTLSLLVILGGIYFFQKLSLKQEKIKPADNEPFLSGEIECSEIRQGYEICLEKSELPINVAVSLKIGKTFVYEVKENDGQGTDKYAVEKIDNIDGDGYYVVRRDFNFTDKSGTSLNDIDKAWYNKNTGEVIRIDFYEPQTNEAHTIEGKVAEFIVSSSWNFAPWMLALGDNFEWEQKYNSTYTTRGQNLYKVVGKEKVNGRESFKVKRTIIVDSKIDSEEYVWVDVQERIIIKTPMQILISGIDFNSKNND